VKVVPNSVIRPTIYCYTTPNDREHEGWCKIGYTDRDTADHCIYKQSRRTDTACVKEWESAAVFDNGSYETFMDHDFHKYLVLCGVERKESVYKGKKAPEYFHISPEKARELLMQFKMLVEPAKVLSKDYVLREEQDRAVNLTLDVMSKEGRKEVLLNAKPTKIDTPHNLLNLFQLSIVALVVHSKLELDEPLNSFTVRVLPTLYGIASLSPL